jgi:hypothetical protein
MRATHALGWFGVADRIAGRRLTPLTLGQSFTLSALSNPYIDAQHGTPEQCAQALAVCGLTWLQCVRMVQSNRLPWSARLWLRRHGTVPEMLKATFAMVQHVREWTGGPSAYHKADAPAAELAIPYEIHLVTFLCETVGMREREAWETPVLKALEMFAAVRERSGQRYVTDASWARWDAQKAQVQP